MRGPLAEVKSRPLQVESQASGPGFCRRHCERGIGFFLGHAQEQRQPRCQLQPLLGYFLCNLGVGKRSRPEGRSPEL